MRTRLAFYAMAIALLSGCYSEGSYRGDGTLIDNGFLVSIGMGTRYVLDLGEIDLTQDGRYEYSVGNLPPGYRHCHPK